MFVFAYHALLLIHVACFAIWMGAIVASLLVVRTFEPRLTKPDGLTSDGELLRAYIRHEVKLVDVVFLSLMISGLALAQFYLGWNTWVFLKIGLFIAQFAATMGFVFLRIRPITYPCTPATYRRWYQLFGVSLSFFAVTLLVVYFGR
ncbi:hypothetical protein EYB53_001085 [Candidatus Chloroploca sp. M-50]|uniref:Copper resistance protein D domain-containing protein n=2 Tax=Candidatus Chloroploca TaxID=1579476 RepID=A0A2H3KGF3_9CHLR|nr:MULTISPECIES: hypothetical protein [Candidatus Chloroploca]MBP1464291.1 hypothetical protein [Candidatus Chloroploca mongolica]PDV96779.1 hypothetical protein A9Q02_06035 [Candidatus Chloroploca asiatica]